MSATTLPKSVQARNSNLNLGPDDLSSFSSPEARRQHYRAFIDQLKPLPNDFLRIPQGDQIATGLGPSGHHAGRSMPNREPTPLVDMVDISVVEAQLVKNYGILRMDLYCKIRVGHMVCETQTCLNGAKNPKWDGIYQFSLKPGIDSFHLEIYDEKQFSLDEKIAWLYEPIPPEIFQGITVERWFPLSGRLGPNKEGSILLVFSHKRVPMRSSSFNRSAMMQGLQNAPMTVFVPATNQGPTVSGPTVVPSVEPSMLAQHQLPPSRPQIMNVPYNPVPQIRPVSDEDVDQLSEMFPSVDKAVIRAVLENHHNDKEGAIGALLALG